MSDRPEIEVKEAWIDGVMKVFQATCPIGGCQWFDVDSCRDDVESAAGIHADWHENGMPE